jgi:hypothetical protein
MTEGLLLDSLRRSGDPADRILAAAGEYTISYLLLATARFLNMAQPAICE